MPVQYSYSPQLQPGAWWAQAQQRIPGLQALPQGATGASLAELFEQMQPHRGVLADLYQQAMSAPQRGTQTDEGGVQSTIPTEAGNTALSELIASAAGTSRVSTTPLAGLPWQIGSTQYGYGGAGPQAPVLQPGQAGYVPPSVGGFLIPGTGPGEGRNWSLIPGRGWGDWPAGTPPLQYPWGGGQPPPPPPPPAAEPPAEGAPPAEDGMQQAQQGSGGSRQLPPKPPVDPSSPPTTAPPPGKQWAWDPAAGWVLIDVYTPGAATEDPYRAGRRFG